MGQPQSKYQKIVTSFLLGIFSGKCRVYSKIFYLKIEEIIIGGIKNYGLYRDYEKFF